MAEDGNKEGNGFIDDSLRFKRHRRRRMVGYFHSNIARNCCLVSSAIGSFAIFIGILILIVGEGMIEKKVLNSMALTPGSDRTESWLRPPVQPHLTAYAFHIENPDGVLKGEKPVLVEKGPYVYKSSTIKDSDDNIVWAEDNSDMIYRPRKIYQFVPEMSVSSDPFKDFITVPNIPLWTGLNAIRPKSQTVKNMVKGIVLDNGLKTPFINVSFGGLLWGYEDDLPCMKLPIPEGCASEDDQFGSSSFDWDDDDDFKRRRKRRSVDFSSQDVDYESLVKPKAEFVNCKCNWGLFRDRNVTMRKPIQFLTGVSELGEKGQIMKFDNSDVLGWWKKGSVCDKVQGQDSSTLPPQISKGQTLDIFIALMCRRLPMTFEKETEHADIKTYRFIPTPNAMGSHTDPDPAKRNPDNECYCVNDEGFECFKSGVLNMEPCKRDTHAPLALSMPHFYQADSEYGDAVVGLNPDKDKHQFFMDVVPEFGFPLAIRPRFQLNVVIGKYMNVDWDVIDNMVDKVVLPFLWAQDGFDEPSVEMADKIKFGLKAPSLLSMLLSVVTFFVGGVLVLSGVAYFVYLRRSDASASRLKTGALDNSNNDHIQSQELMEINPQSTHT